MINYASNITNSEYQNDIIIKLFLTNVLEKPNNNAVYIDEQYYTYQELFNVVHAIYSILPVDTHPNHIGVYCNNDIYTYASILAIKLFGAAYIPLNSSFPVERNKNIIRQCTPSFLLSSLNNEETTAFSFLLDVINTKEVAIKKVNYDKTFRYAQSNQHLSYILFTSGTTGEPKGVPVSKANTNSFFNHMLATYAFNGSDRFLQVFDLTFDVSVFSFFTPLLCGGCCYVLPSDGVKYLKILECLQKFEITVVAMVPTLLTYIKQYLSQIQLPHLRYSIFAGDVLYNNLAMLWQLSVPNAKVFNMYGPTECTIVCSSYTVNENDRLPNESIKPLPIGKLFDKHDFLIIDNDDKRCEKGELCIAGCQVIDGYINNENSEKFLVEGDKKYYKTGDLVSLNLEGDLVFHGRVDSQVKINGYRVELMEIEKAIITLTKCNCVVVHSLNHTNLGQLVAYIETNGINEEKLKGDLRSLLPIYMIPNAYIAIEKFKLNANGKIDKNFLKH